MTLLLFDGWWRNHSWWGCCWSTWVVVVCTRRPTPPSRSPPRTCHFTWLICIVAWHLLLPWPSQHLSTSAGRNCTSKCNTQSALLSTAWPSTVEQIFPQSTFGIHKQQTGPILLSYSVFVLVFPYFSFPCRTLDYAGDLVSFWAHVNLSYRVVSYIVSLIHTNGPKQVYKTIKCIIAVRPR